MQIDIDIAIFDEKTIPLPDGSKPQRARLEGDCLVIYGIPGENHNCDEMGCPSIDHVLRIFDVEKVKTK